MSASYSVVGLVAMLVIGLMVLWIERRRGVHACAICDQPGGFRCRGMWVCAHHKSIIRRIHGQ